MRAAQGNLKVRAQEGGRLQEFGTIQNSNVKVITSS